MNLEVVTIGTELLLGHTIDTNAADLCRALTSVGALVVRKTTIGDDPAEIRAAVAGALERTGFVITTGGLGPTSDDVTKRAVARLFGVALVVNDDYLGRLERRWHDLGRRGPMPEANRTQAEVPAGATILPNPRGTAPGLWLEGEPGVAVLLPGVPHEMRGLVADEVAPRLARRVGADRVTVSRVLRTTGIAESALADRLRHTETELDSVTLAYLPTLRGVDLRITAWSMPAQEAGRVLDRAADILRKAVGTPCYGEEGADLAAVVVERLRNRGICLAVAESCTGGLVGGRITAVPGASTVFAGGVIAYADEVKIRELGVAESVLAEHGAVSEAAVVAMARGVAARFGTRAAVAVSGIAGPGGGTADKPVGTVWIAGLVAGSERVVRVGLPGDRYEIRARAAQSSLDVLRRLLGRDDRESRGSPNG